MFGLVSQKASQLAVVVTCILTIFHLRLGLTEGFTASCGCDFPNLGNVIAITSQKASQLAVVVTLTEFIKFDSNNSQKVSQLAVVVTLLSYLQ